MHCGPVFHALIFLVWFFWLILRVVSAVSSGAGVGGVCHAMVVVMEVGLNSDSILDECGLIVG
jgi:hypothetical protein